MSANVEVAGAVDNPGWRDWGSAEACDWITVPEASDDKYSRGVLGIVTGSDLYPGAAVLGVEAAVRTGVGMVRYRGPARATDLVLQRRPEAVTAAGRVQAWLIGSGMDAAARSDDDDIRLRTALADAVPLVVDAGALDLVGSAAGPVVITPHFRELATVLSASGVQRPDPAVSIAEAIAADPAHWCARASQELGATVLLKGHTTYIASPHGTRLRVTAGPAWLATAGSGDVLGGMLGALVATHADAIAADESTLARLAATAAYVHGRAGERASGGGPIAALDIAEAVPAIVVELLTAREREH